MRVANFIRLTVVAFLAAFAAITFPWREAFGHFGAEDGLRLVVGLALLLGVVFGALFAYFLPTFVAGRRGHLSVLAIALANLVFGWTLIGWIACMIWALTGDTRANRRLNFEG